MNKIKLIRNLDRERRLDMQILAGMFLVIVMGLPLLVTFVEYMKQKKSD